MENSDEEAIDSKFYDQEMQKIDLKDFAAVEKIYWRRKQRERKCT
jgi:hypothetical protein